MKILVTGAAGFIGAALFRRLAMRGDEVTGVDNINDYYDVSLKYARLHMNGFLQDDIPFGKEICSSIYPECRFIRLSIDDKDGMERLFEEDHFDKVVNLAAQAGVRYSMKEPYAYLQSNVAGFLIMLECCRRYGVPSMIYASSSSVYGMNKDVPYSEDDRTDNPESLYAATKKADEMMAHAYCRLYGINMTGLRYFTVYGPYGRPDMAPMLFTDAILRGETVKVFNGGDLKRDFTYIDDAVEGTLRLLDLMPVRNAEDNADEHGMFSLYNIGCSSPVRLMDFIGELETALGRKAVKTMLPMQPGDVKETFADVSKLERATGFRPTVSLHDGIRRFIDWYLDFYKEQGELL